MASKKPNKKNIICYEMGLRDFTMFTKAEIEELREAFRMMVQPNYRGFIDKKDLQKLLSSLGKDVEDEYLEGMMQTRQGRQGLMNFSRFVTLFGKTLTGTDPKDVIKSAFACFHKDGTETIHEDRL